MTTIYPEDVACLLCGAVSRQYLVGSSNTMGAPDLDTRPAEMMRSTIEHQIQSCPGCGYCAPDIGTGPREAFEVVLTESYAGQRDRPDMPRLANEFLCWAMIQISADDFADAGWAALQAAWVCDDADMPEASAECRRMAADHFETAKRKGQSFAGGVGTEEAMLAEVYRRSGLFELAEFSVAHGLALNPEPHVVGILEFQRGLIRKGDMDCYTLDQVHGGVPEY